MKPGGLKRVADEYAETIINTVMRERMIGPGDFWHSLASRVVAARRAAIKRLFKEGFTYRHIAEAMNCRLKTVQYHLSDRYAQNTRNSVNRRRSVPKKPMEARA